MFRTHDITLFLYASFPAFHVLSPTHLITSLLHASLLHASCLIASCLTASFLIASCLTASRLVALCFIASRFVPRCQKFACFASHFLLKSQRCSQLLFNFITLISFHLSQRLLSYLVISYLIFLLFPYHFHTISISRQGLYSLFYLVAVYKSSSVTVLSPSSSSLAASSATASKVSAATDEVVSI